MFMLAYFLLKLFGIIGVYVVAHLSDGVVGCLVHLDAIAVGYVDDGVAFLYPAMGVLESSEGALTSHFPMHQAEVRFAANEYTIHEEFAIGVEAVAGCGCGVHRISRLGVGRKIETPPYTSRPGNITIPLIGCLFTLTAFRSYLSIAWVLVCVKSICKEKARRFDGLGVL